MALRVNLGCGADIREGFVNVDREKLPGVDVVANLDCAASDLCGATIVCLPFDDDSVELFLAVDLVEHIAHPLPLFQELWRCAMPGATIEMAMPYGGSDDAWMDPTHKRPWFVDSWTYLAQPNYWKLDYGYTADWKVDLIVLEVGDSDETDDQLLGRVMRERNVVRRQYVALSAVKPARPRDVDLLTGPPIRFRKVA